MNIKLIKRITMVVLVLVVIGFSAQWAYAQEDDPPLISTEYYTVENQLTAKGLILQRITIAGPPNPPLGLGSTASHLSEIDAAATVQLSVPYSDWAFGCSATSAAMIAGYYDQNDYPNMYTGPTNSGVYPSSDAIWGYWQDGAGDWISLNPLSASKNGLDGRTSKGSVDDYWEEYDAGGGGYHDPWYGNWVEHTYEGATGDYMYTNQWEHGYCAASPETGILAPML